VRERGPSTPAAELAPDDRARRDGPSGEGGTQAPMPDVAPGPGAHPLAIEVADLGVQYSLRLTRQRSFRQSAGAFFRRRKSTFWALRHLHLTVPRGQVLAVIGPNGAGKTTLLQALAGILKPSEGNVTVRGTVGTFLGSGGAFDFELSGRHNIGLFAAFLGTDPRELRRRMESIIRFADVGEHIDAPLRTYSKGMRARLGFSVASVMEPDILLLDEAVSAGDYEYRTRSKARVRELARESRAIVLVTHDLEWVIDFCTRAIILERGGVMADGEPADVVKRYKERAMQARAAGDRRYPWVRAGRR
jgi:ABC-type polysaccharide/polyol phosphate transport system ATPase subunit